MMSAVEKDEKLMEEMRKLVSLLLLLLCIEGVTACTYLYVHVHMFVGRKFHKLKFLYTCTLLRLMLQCR